MKMKKRNWTAKQVRTTTRPDESGSRFSSSLARGLNILELFAREGHELGITEVANELGVSASTCHRYVHTLVTLGYLEQYRLSGRYGLGFKVMDLGMAAINSLGFIQVARPYLHELWESTGRSVDIGVLDGNEVVYVDMVKNPGGVVLDIPVGSRLPAHSSAIGKVLLAELPPERLEVALSKMELRPMGPNTITTAADLIADLQMSRERGFAYNNEETAPGLRTVAAPIRASSGEAVAAINLAVYSWMTSWDDPITAYAALVCGTAGRVSAKLGYRPAMPNERSVHSDQVTRNV